MGKLIVLNDAVRIAREDELNRAAVGAGDEKAVILRPTFGKPSLEDAARERDIAIVNHDAARSSFDGVAPWIREDHEIDLPRLVSDIQEHDEWINQLIVARDMRKTILRFEIVKTGKLSARVSPDVTVVLKPREDIVCSCHRLEVGECGTQPDQIKLEKRVIDEPIQRAVVIEDNRKKVAREAARGVR